jgi:hypothetical protein
MVVFAVDGTLMMRALGLADAEPRLNDRCRAQEGRTAPVPPPSTALKNQDPWIPEQDAPYRSVTACRRRDVRTIAQPEDPQWAGVAWRAGV